MHRASRLNALRSESPPGVGPRLGRGVRSEVRDLQGRSPTGLAKSSSLALRTAHSSWVALHPFCWKRSYHQLRGGNDFSDRDFHPTIQSPSQAHLPAAWATGIQKRKLKGRRPTQVWGGQRTCVALRAGCSALVPVAYATGNGCASLWPESQIPARNGTKLAET